MAEKDLSISINSGLHLAELKMAGSVERAALERLAEARWGHCTTAYPGKPEVPRCLEVREFLGETSRPYSPPVADSRTLA